MSANVINLDDRRPSPWESSDGCDCSACAVRRIGQELDERLRHTEDLLSLDAADALRFALQQLGDLVGVQCHYVPRQVQ